MLLIYVDETDLWETGPLYEAIMRRLRQLGLAGATAQVGSMGFGSNRKLHHKRLFGISDDRPVTISVVDTESAIRAALPEIRGMVKDGLIALIDVEVIEPEAGRDVSSK
jgi:hypothetical protein